LEEVIWVETAITDEGNRTRRYDYDSLGRLFRATDLSGATWWTNQFDPTNGALIAVISPTAETNAYVYDDLDNVKAMRFSDNNWLTNFYNLENRLSGVRLPSGVMLTNHYDFAGRLTNRSSTIGETASFEYNGNDAVTKMSDNTGSTTNLFDAAGRLWGIDYPSGASVRYQLDVLDRITAITNKASASGTNYVTRYQYDAVGNVTNVVDPFNGNTSLDLEYDRVGRRTKRTLPNSVVTEWQYDWRDRVTNITHKISSTVLASVGYERAAGGEPTKITREDGTYVELKYDPAWRLTNEVFYAGGSPQTTNSYVYDASGSRIKLVQGNLTLTNAVSGGYQITAVKNAANGNTTNSYAYDAGGRVTSINRDGAILNLGYNTADQVQAVTNGANWVTYAHDASGRRTLSVNNTSVRKFLVAPTPGTDLESPQLIANASGDVQQGYVYLGDDPILRYGTGGTAAYYLEDGMGSIIGIAPTGSPGTGNTTRLFYDGFGNTRATNGPAPSIASGTGGDFRFHGAWLEADSGLYHMRAREYDARMGRFTSRDPVGGDFKAAETLNPYVFALNNPFIYSDPSGEHTLIELMVVAVKQVALQALKSLTTHYAKQRATRSIASSFGRFVGEQIMGFLGFDWATSLQNIIAQAANSKTPGLTIGRDFGALGARMLCSTIGRIDGLEDQIHSEVRVSAVQSGRGPVGTPLTAGRPCPPGENQPRPRGWTVGIKYAIPDFIIGDKPIASVAPRAFNRSFLVGDFKLSAKALYDDYAAKKPRKPEQFDATIGYAKQHTFMRTALFIIGHNSKALPGGKATKKEMLQVKKLMGRTLVKKGVLPAYIVLVD